MTNTGEEHLQILVRSEGQYYLFQIMPSSVQLPVISVAVCGVESVQNVVSDESWPQDGFSLSGNEIPSHQIQFFLFECSISP